MYCKHCGHEAKEGARFCKECGQQLASEFLNDTQQINDNENKKVLQENAATINPVSKEPTNPEMTPKRKLGKKWIIFGSAIIVLIILFSSAYSVGSSKYKPESKIDSFEQAVKDNDVKKVKSMLTTDDDSFKITTDNTKGFVHYLHEHPDQLNNLIEKMKEQVKSKSADTASYGKYATINIVKSGKKWVVFNDYKLSIVPAFVKVTANQDDIDFYIDDKKMGSSKKGESQELGPLMPGAHDIKATYNSKYVETNQHENMEVFAMSEKSLDKSFQFDLKEVTSKVNLSDGGYTLFINDKKTDIKLDNNSQEIGMLPVDGSVKIHAEKEYPWGTAKSEVITVDGDYTRFDQVFVLTEAQQKDLMDQLNTSIDQYFEKAMTKKDVSYLKGNVSDNLTKQAKKDIRSIKEKKKKYTAKLLKTNFRKDDFRNVSYNDGLNAYTLNLMIDVTLLEKNDRYFLWVGGGDYKNDIYDHAFTFTVYFDEKKKEWILDHFKKEYNFVGSGEGIEFEMKKADTNKKDSKKTKDSKKDKKKG